MFILRVFLFLLLILMIMYLSLIFTYTICFHWFPVYFRSRANQMLTKAAYIVQSSINFVLCVYNPPMYWVKAKTHCLLRGWVLLDWTLEFNRHRRHEVRLLGLYFPNCKKRDSAQPHLSIPYVRPRISKPNEFNLANFKSVCLCNPYMCSGLWQTSVCVLS